MSFVWHVDWRICQFDWRICQFSWRICQVLNAGFVEIQRVMDSYPITLLYACHTRSPSLRFGRYHCRKLATNSRDNLRKEEGGQRESVMIATPNPASSGAKAVHPPWPHSLDRRLTNPPTARTTARRARDASQSVSLDRWVVVQSDR